MTQSNCQVCGNPMYSQNYYGTEEGGELNSAFCSSCYKEGKFYSSQGSNESFVGMYPWPLGGGGF